MTELKKRFDNKFHCPEYSTDFFQKKNQKRRRITNQYKHTKSNKQFPKKKALKPRYKKIIKRDMVRDNLYNQNLQESNAKFIEPSYKEVLLSDFINNAIEVYKNTWDIIDDSKIIKQEMNKQNKKSYSIFNIFGV